MANRLFVILIALSLLAAAVGLARSFAATDDTLGNLLFTYGSGIGQLAGLLLLLYNGTTIGTVYFRIIQFCVGVSIIGTLFRIMHWVGTSIILPVSLGSIAVTYAVRFAKKSQKSRLDVLKLLWVLAAISCSVLLFQHLISHDVAFVPQAILWLAIMDFVATGLANKTLYE